MTCPFIFPHLIISIFFKLFAADIKSYTFFNNISQIITFQIFINCIFNWCQAWQLTINSSKSLILHLGRSNLIFNYHISETIILCCLSVPDMVVLINSRLTFDLHMAKIISTARSRCILYLKSFISCDAKTMLKFYTTYA